jgi:hypothetical protein
MKTLTVAAAALAVFFLALGMIASAPATAPAVNMDRCLMCHPQAHPADWMRTSHISELKAGEVTAAECTRCHDAQYCTNCHAQVRLMQQQSGTAAQPLATTP